MKFSVAAVAALAAGAQASYSAVGGNVTYTTEVVSVYTTYCPEATQLTYGSKTYTITEATTLTITDCPCTVSKPVYTTSAVVCKTCTSSAAASSSAAVTTYPVTSASVKTTAYANSTIATSTTVKASTATTAAATTTASVVTAGAAKVAALSGAGLFALVAALL